MSKRRYLFPFVLMAGFILVLFTSCPGSPEIPKLAVPVITASSDVIDEDTLITITSSEGGAIWYTEDGTDPRSSSSREAYDEPFSPLLDRTITIKAYATLSGYLDSDVVEKTFTYSGQLPQPVFEYDDQSTIPFTQVRVHADAADGYAIYYTLDGSDPGEAAQEAVDGLIDLSGVESGNVTVKAVTVKEGMTSSEISTATYIRKKVETPQISPDSQMFEQGLEVTITAEKGAQVFYTLDGADPTRESYEYKKPFILEDVTTVKAMAVMDGCFDSETAMVEYSLETPAPVFSSQDGVVPFLDGNLTISAGEDDTIYYTLDGTEPTTSSRSNIGSVELTIKQEGVVVKAFASRPGYEPSDIVSISVTQARLDPPEISYPSPFILDESEVTISSEVEGAVITYSSEEFGDYVAYTGPFKLTEMPSTYHQNIFAKVEMEGYKSSSAYVSFDILERVDSIPVFSLPGGSPNAKNLELSISGPFGSTVYYTMDGSEPVMNGSYSYSSPIPLDSSVQVVKAMYVSTSDKAISHVATLELEAALDPGIIDGEWISSEKDLTVSDGIVTVEDNYNPTIYNYALSGNMLVIVHDVPWQEMVFQVSQSGEGLLLTMENEVYTLVKDGNRYLDEANGVSLIYNDDSFSIETNDVFYAGSVSDNTLSVESLVIKSEISKADIQNGPIEIPILGTIYRKPEFRVSPNQDELAVNEEVEISLSHDFLPSGITVGEIKYVLKTYDSEEPLETGVYSDLNPIRYTPTSKGSLICEFHIPLTFGEGIERELLVGGVYAVLERYGTPYLGPYTVLTDHFMEGGDGIRIKIRDLDPSYSGYLHYSMTDAFYGEEENFTWNPNRTYPDGYSEDVETYNEDYIQTGVIKGILSEGASLDYLPSIPNIKTFYSSDTSSAALEGKWYGSMDYGGNNSINLALTVDSGCGYDVSADGMGVVYEGKARYSNERNMILIDFKSDNKLPEFQPVSLQYSYDSSSDEVTINNVVFQRAAGKKGSEDGYWIEKNADDEVLGREFARDGQWIAYRGALWSARNEIYIYEGSYNEDSDSITFPASAEGIEGIDSYYILTYPCLSEDGKTLTVAGLDFSR